MERTTSKNGARKAASSPQFRMLARAGFAATGLLHVVIGVIAISVAVGAGGGEADASGALGRIAATPGGLILLWVLVAGLAALGLWQVVQVILARGADRKRKWARRISDVSKAVTYFALAFVAATFAAGGSKSSATSSETFSAKLLSAPGGVFVLVAVGLGIVAVGGFFIFRGVSRRFTRDIVIPPPPTATAVTVLGAVGYVTKGVALVIVGILFVVAAISFDPSKAKGLDGALKSLAQLPFGTVILLVVAIGLIAYGLYCGARAWLARLN